MHSIICKMQQESCSLRSLKGADYLLQEPISCQTARTSRQAFYKEIGELKKIEQANALSRRERDCLKLLLNGMTANETASTLMLSFRTVEHYFENIKNKFGCQSKKELLKVARELNIIGLLDLS